MAAASAPPASLPHPVAPASGEVVFDEAGAVGANVTVEPDDGVFLDGEMFVEASVVEEHDEEGPRIELPAPESAWYSLGPRTLSSYSPSNAITSLYREPTFYYDEEEGRICFGMLYYVVP